MTVGLVTPAALFRAVAKLARARLFLNKATGEQIAALATFAAQPPPVSATDLPREIKRVAYLLPRVAARLPWRADCLVQALAAQRWLAILGHDSWLHLGSRKDEARLLAHAWLTWNGHVVTGGEVGGYVPFVRSHQR